MSIRFQSPICREHADDWGDETYIRLRSPIRRVFRRSHAGQDNVRIIDMNEVIKTLPHDLSHFSNLLEKLDG